MGKGSIEGAKPRSVARLETKAPKAKKTPKVARPAKASAPKPGAAAAPFQPAGTAPAAKLTLNDVSKDRTPWVGDVGALLKKYGAAGDLKFSRPIERILVQTAAIDKMFTDSARGPAGLVQGLVDRDARRTVFMLEGFLRLYAKELGNKGEKALTNVKTLEDNLGNISLHNELLKTATGAQLPGTIIDALAEEKDSQKVEYEDFIEGWVRPDREDRSPLIAEVITTLVDHQEEFHGYEHDRRNTFERLGKMMHHLAEDPFDMNQPVTGIHELRRHIRWLPVDIEALNGLVVLDEKLNPLDAYKPILKTDLAKSKFVNLPPPSREPEPLHVSKSLYTAMMDAVLKLGSIKDKYEPLTLIGDLYVKQGLAADVHEARTMLDPLIDPSETERDYQKEAAAVYEDLRKKGLFAAMAKEYDAAAANADSGYPI
jgi:hypothetical protein